MLVLLFGALGLFAAAQAQTIPTDVNDGFTAAITNFAVTSGNEKLTLSWTSSRAFSRGVWVQYKTNTDTSWTWARSSEENSQPYEITDLTNGVAYDVRIFGLDCCNTDLHLIRSAFITGSGTPKSTDATLSALTVSSSTSGTGTFTALSIGTFASSTTIYTATVANSVTHVKLTPTVNDSDATVKVGKGSSLTAVSSGSASGAIPLLVGANAIKAVVTAEDGTTTKTYTVTVTRRQTSILSVTATPACGSTVSDMSVKVRYLLSLTPAPEAGEEEATQYAIVNAVGTLLNAWAGASSIRDTGRAPMTDNNTFAEYRAAFPTFAGFKFRLTHTHGVTAQCLWSFPATSQSPGGGRTDGTDTGGGGSGGGGGGSGGGGGGGSGGGGGTPPSSEDSPLPEEPQDPDQSDDCGDDDRENLVRFYDATDGDNWDENKKTNWNSQKPLDQWSGVDTDEDGEVVSLRLADSNLSGDMPTEELLCLDEDTELKELALWDNEGLLGDVPEGFVLAVERAVLRDIAEKIDLEPGWFEDYGDPFSFEEWYEGVVMTDEEDGRVRELDFTEEGIIGVIPRSVFELEKLTVIKTGCGVTLEVEEPEGEREVKVMIMPADDCPEETAASGDGGCAVGQGDFSVSGFGLFLVALVVFAVLVRKRARAESFPLAWK